MPRLDIILNADEEAMPHVPDQLRGRKIKQGMIEAIGGIPRGMDSGKTSVALSIKMKDGSWVFAETSLKMLQLATAALAGKYGNETDDPTLLMWVDGPGSEAS